MILIADKAKRLAGITHPLNDRHQQATSTIFEAHLSRSVVRLKKVAIRPPWRQKNIPGVLYDDLIGSCTDGSVFQLSILNAEVWRLLKFVENLCRWADEVARLDAGPGYCVRVVVDPDRDIANTRSRKTGYHVDGDVLDRLLRVGGRRELKAMLELPLLDEEDTEGEADFNAPPEERVERFFALAGAALGTVDGDVDVVIGHVVDWMRDILAPML